MIKTPKSLRLQIGLFGRTNVGKSSVLNMIAGQKVAITSSTPGTTTDVVEKSMELLPIGPVVFLDTAGLDDVSLLAEKRIEKTKKIYRRADIAVLITEPGIWGVFEEQVVKEAEKVDLPVLVIINKCDTSNVEDDLEKQLEAHTGVASVLRCSALDTAHRDLYIHEFKQRIIAVVPEDFITPPPLLGDLMPEGGHTIFIIPIDIEAPKGRIILPQVQALRDVLDADSLVTVVKEDQYLAALENCRKAPDLVVCDSQVVDRMVRETPEDIPCTTFSTLFSRYKGELYEQIAGAAAIDELTPDDRILVAEACSHHAMEDDIGRVKIPRWLNEYLGFEPRIDTYSGRDYPEDLAEYALVIHCGACMLTRREMLLRIERAREAGVAITNYGVCIAHLKGTLERIISPFEGAVEMMRQTEKEGQTV